MIKKVFTTDNPDNLWQDGSNSVEDSVFRAVFNNNQVVMLLVDPENNQQILDVNEAAWKFYGYTREQFLCMNMGQINTISEEEWHRMMGEAINKPHSHFNFIHKTSSGLLKDVEIHASPIVYNNKKVMFVIVYDITDRKKTENQLYGLTSVFEDLSSDPRKNINLILERTCDLLDGVCVLYNKLDDEDGSLVVWDAYKAPEDLLKRDNSDGHICYEATIRGKNKVIAIEDLNETEYLETDPNVRKYGLRSYLGYPVTLGARAIGSLCILYTVPRKFKPVEFQIISTLAKAVSIEEERIETRQQLQSSEEKYRSYFENSPLSLWEQDYSDVVSYLHGLPVSGEENLRKYLDKYPEEVVKCSEKLRILDVNPVTIRMYEARSKEDLFRNLGNIYTQESFEMFKNKLIFLYNNESTLSDETIHKTLRGRKIYVKLETTLLPNLRALVTITDITELKKSESDLKELLAQTRADTEIKEILLREINHRVKNNLSSFIGMLYAEKKQFGHEVEDTQLAHIDSLINRVKGISVAHELLSRSQWAPISINNLSGKIVHSLRHLIPADRFIETKITPTSIFLDADQGHSMAIIVNELFVNCIEHAAHTGEKVKVKIDIKEKKGKISYVYSDNGPGFPENVLNSGFQNVGLYLIKNIVEQNLKGTVILENKGGARVTINFPGGTEFEEL